MVSAIVSESNSLGSSPGRGHCVHGVLGQDTLLSQSFYDSISLSNVTCTNGYRRT